MRDIAVTLVILGALPFCLRSPWIGILVWSWFGYMNPHRLAWGFARDLPFAMAVAIAVMVGIVLGRDPERRPLPWVRETWLLFGLWAIFAATTLVALYPGEAWPQLSKVSKVLLFTFITILFFQTRERLRYLVLVIALSLGFYGLKSTPFVFLTGGAFRVEGPTGTFIGGNTGLGLALDMALPLLFYAARGEERVWLKRLLWAAFACSILGVLFTYSRGALLGLVVVLLMLFMRAKRRVVAIGVLAALALAMMMFAPEQWFGRVRTLENVEEDASARSRLVSWRLAWELAIDRPLTGGGFWALPHAEIYRRYLRHLSEEELEVATRKPHSAHSIYFAVLGDHGFPGLAFFVALLISCFLSIRALRREARDRPEMAWVLPYCAMIQVSLMAYAISGAFLTQSYFDLFYHLVAFVIVLKAIVVRERLEPVVPSPSPVGIPAGATA